MKKRYFVVHERAGESIGEYMDKKAAIAEAWKLSLLRKNGIKVYWIDRASREKIYIDWEKEGLIDMELVVELLDSDISGDRIEAMSGVSKVTIHNYRKNRAKLENMTLRMACILQAYWLYVKAMKIQELTIDGIEEAVKEFNNWTEGPAVICFDSDNDRVYTKTAEYGDYGWESYRHLEDDAVAEKGFDTTEDLHSKATVRKVQLMCRKIKEERAFGYM